MLNAKNVVVMLAALVRLSHAQAGRQASAGPLSDVFNSLGGSRIGYAPGVHQAVANTGAQPNPFNLVPGLAGQSVEPGQLFQAPIQAFGSLAQSGTQVLQGLAQGGGQFLREALIPFQSIVQGGLSRTNRARN